MRFLILTTAILVLLGINHAIHGTGCWGYQPGGKYSMMLMLAQVVISTWALLTSLRFAFYQPTRQHIAFLAVGSALGVISFILMSTTGQWMFTSAHNQGTENLIPFLSVSLVSIVIGIEMIASKIGQLRLMSDCPKCGYSLRKLPNRICPECGHDSEEYALQS